ATALSTVLQIDQVGTRLPSRPVGPRVRHRRGQGARAIAPCPSRSASLLSAPCGPVGRPLNQFQCDQPQERYPSCREFVLSFAASSSFLRVLRVERQLFVKLWGGNYSGDPDKDFWEFNRSFPFDRRLVAEEIAASRAYVRALGRCGAIKADEADRLDGALDRLAQQVQADPACLETDAEDVHSFVETRLTEAVGDLAGQAHLGRSRNEQSV